MPPALYAGRQSGVSRWDGTAWQSIGSTDSLLFNIKSVDLDGAGPQPPILVAVGFFTSIGGVPANRVAAWDGTQWTALGSGLGGLGWGIEVFDEDGAGTGAPKLFVTGDFSSAGGNPAVGIASWDGQSWSAVGAGLNGFAAGLLVLDEDGDGPGSEKLFVGGGFTMAGGAPADRVASWDGTTWSSVGSGVTTFPTEFLFADLDGPGPGGSTLIAVGSNGSNTEPIQDNLWVRDGSLWMPLGTGQSSTQYGVPIMRALAVYDADHDGPAPRSVFASGFLTHADGKDTGPLIRWECGQWQGFDNSLVPSHKSLVVHDEDGDGPKPPYLFAGNTFRQGWGVAKWNGECWQSVADRGNSNGNLSPINTMEVFDEDGDGPDPPRLFVAGDITSINGVAANRIALWDGENWSALGAGLGTHPSRVLDLAVCDCDGDGPGAPALFAVGNFDESGGQPINHVAVWDGAIWQQVGTGVDVQPPAFPSAGTDVRAAACFDEDGAGPNPPRLFIAGKFLTIDGLAVNGIAKWDGTSWSGVGTGVDGFTVTNAEVINALFDYDPDADGPLPSVLLAGGDIDGIDGVATTDLAAWDGQSWSAMPDAGLLRINVLTVFDDDGEGPRPATLYAGGGFGGMVARLDGGVWSSLDTGLSDSFFACSSGFGCGVSGLTGFDCDGPGPRPPSLFAAGNFATAGGNESVGIARWSMAEPVTIHSQPKSATTSEGGSAAFSVFALGSGPLTYQWRRNGVPLVDDDRVSGATTRRLRIENVAVGDRGQYDVVVTGVCDDMINSINARLLVSTPGTTGTPVQLQTPMQSVVAE
jgi:hypothetical protein